MEDLEIQVLLYLPSRNTVADTRSDDNAWASEHLAQTSRWVPVEVALKEVFRVEARVVVVFALGNVVNVDFGLQVRSARSISLRSGSGGLGGLGEFEARHFEERY
jgi:hypothetical protein